MKELGADPALYEKIPTADLEEDKPGLADEVALGVTYEEIDDYLEGKTISPEAQATIENWWHKGQHKRHLPITVFDDFWEWQNLQWRFYLEHGNRWQRKVHGGFKPDSECVKN